MAFDSQTIISHIISAAFQIGTGYNWRKSAIACQPNQFFPTGYLWVQLVRLNGFISKELHY